MIISKTAVLKIVKGNLQCSGVYSELSWNIASLSPWYAHLGIVCCPDEPLFEVLLFNLCSRAPGAAIFIDLLICQHCLIHWVPVDQSLKSNGKCITTCWDWTHNSSARNEFSSLTTNMCSGRQPVLCARIFFPLIGKGIKWKGGENFTIYFIYTEFANINQSSNGQEATLIIAGLTIIKSAIRLIIVWPIAFTLALPFSCLFGDNNICCSNSSGDLEGL